LNTLVLFMGLVLVFTVCGEDVVCFRRDGIDISRDQTAWLMRLPVFLG